MEDNIIEVLKNAGNLYKLRYIHLTNDSVIIDPGKTLLSLEDLKEIEDYLKSNCGGLRLTIGNNNIKECRKCKESSGYKTIFKSEEEKSFESDVKVFVYSLFIVPSIIAIIVLSVYLWMGDF